MRAGPSADVSPDTQGALPGVKSSLGRSDLRRSHLTSGDDPDGQSQSVAARPLAPTIYGLRPSDGSAAASPWRTAWSESGPSPPGAREPQCYCPLRPSAPVKSRSGNAQRPEDSSWFGPATSSPIREREDGSIALARNRGHEAWL